MSKLRSFFSSLPPDPVESADPASDQATFSPDDLFAQTLKADGYKAGTDPCYDAAWSAYKDCLKSGTLPGICLAQLHTDQENCARNSSPGQADSTSLTTVDAAYVSSDGGKSPVAAPKLDGEYDLCVKIANRGKVNAPSGPFVVRFELQGDKVIQKTFKSDAGLQVGFSLVAVAPLKQFPGAGKYKLRACVADASTPNKDINCTSSTELVVSGSSAAAPAPRSTDAGFLQDAGSDEGQQVEDESEESNLASAAPAPKSAGKDTPQDADAVKAPQTDDSGLFCNDTAHVSEDGETDEAHPTFEVDYFFYADFANGGKLPSGPCFVQFKLTDDIKWQDDFDLDDGLKAGEKVRAIVHYGTFPKKDRFTNCRLNVCIYSRSAPDKAIACAGEFGITIGTM